MKAKKIALGLLAALTLGVPARAGGLSAGAPADVTPGLAEGNQRWPAVAAGKDGYLVAWQDGAMMAGVEKVSIMAARVGADGKTLDPKGLAICDAEGLRGYPSVAFDGTAFLVAWQDYRNGEDWDLYAARVSTEGKVLDAGGVAVAAMKGNQVYPSVGSDGKGTAFIAWSDVRPGFKPELYRIYGAFVRRGKAAGAFEVAKGEKASLLDPRAAWDGEGYAVVANEGVPGWSPGHSRAYRVSAGGQASPWKLAGFLAWSYAFGADPAGKRTCVFSSNRFGHGSYHNAYMVNVAQGASTGARHVLAGLQDTYSPRNDLWAAVAFDGKNFVAVVEQSDLQKRGHHAAPSVWLVATRVDPKTAATLDLPSGPAEGTKVDMRGPTGTPAYKQAVEKGKTQKGLRAAYEKDVQLRHPALASAGGGKSLLVYSRHGGVNKFKIHAVVLTE